MGTPESMFEAHAACLREMPTDDVISYYKSIAPEGKKTYEYYKEAMETLDDIILIRHCVKELKSRGLKMKTVDKKISSCSTR
jgi:hypothetical protein